MLAQTMQTSVREQRFQTGIAVVSKLVLEKPVEGRKHEMLFYAPVCCALHVFSLTWLE